MELGLTGRLAIVTGASKGIGAATARLLATEGCDTVLVARSEAQLKRTADRIAAETGRAVTPWPADLSKPEEAVRVARKWSHADILVNNAGAIPGGRLEDVDDPTWRAAWDLKVFGYINMTRHMFAAMSARGDGVIVNVLGAAAQTRDPTYICGVTGNAALTAFTMSLGSDSHRHGVRVVGVSPGPVATERLTELGGSVQTSAARPFGRAADPVEIASAVVFFGSPASGYTSGTVLMVDGGLSARAAL
ncbi:short-chain dehydrogenase/reductase [Streptomyces sp. NPDC047081]|uniref:short-chain dehydrogenase/reductase n=1 Tax=Streptomyces sp. NPDC047081 TaxID=3154706 RepID=UPI003407D201